MNLKSILNEARSRGEKIKNEVVSEVLKSKTLQEIVSNKHFIRALTRVIETKDEVRKVINTQVQHLFDMMEVPTREDLIRLAGKLGNLEKVIEKVGRNSIAVRILPQLRSAAKKSSLKAAASKKTAARTSSVRKKAGAKRKKTGKKA